MAKKVHCCSYLGRIGQSLKDLAYFASSGLVVKGGDSYSRGHELDSRHRNNFSHLFVEPIVVVLFKKPEDKMKRFRGWLF